MKHILKAGLKAGIFMLVDNATWGIRYSRHPEKYPIEKRFTKVQKLAKRVTNGLGGKIYVFGKENIDENVVSCYYSNHYSAFDSALMVDVMEKPMAFVAKEEIRKFFILGRMTRVLGAQFIKRDDLKQSLKVMQTVQTELESAKINWLIYPEGTRNKDSMAPVPEFHYGSFKAPMRAKVPIVPVAIYGTFRILKTKPEHNVYPMEVAFCKPIMPEEYENLSTKEVAKLVRDRIQKEIMYNLRPFDNKIMHELKAANYKIYRSY